MHRRGAAAAASTLSLFDGPPVTRERALELCRRFPVGASLRLQRCTCRSCPPPGSGRKPHRSNWIASVRDAAGKFHNVYLGSDANKLELEAAWRLLEAERDELAAKQRKRLATLARSPEALAIAELEAIAFMPVHPSRRRARAIADDVATVPILELVSPRERAAR